MRQVGALRAERVSVLLGVFLFVLASACARTASQPRPTTAVVEAPQFPRDWRGVWKGLLAVTAPGRPNKAIAMELHIEPRTEPDRWTWRLVYDGQPRDYALVVIDRDAGRFQIDEGEVVLDALLVDRTLHSQFSVGGRLLEARYTRRGETIEFEIVVITIPAPAAGDDDVRSHPIEVVQRATLAR